MSSDALDEILSSIPFDEQEGSSDVLIPHHVGELLVKSGKARYIGDNLIEYIHKENDNGSRKDGVDNGKE